LLKNLKNNKDDAMSIESGGSDKSNDELEGAESEAGVSLCGDEEDAVINIYSKEKINAIKEENGIILNKINNIKKTIDILKSDKRKLMIKKKSLEKEVDLINEEISILDDDKQKNISDIKFYIALKISKLKNIDYVYDKKIYRFNLNDDCAILSTEQYKDIIKKIEKISKKKEKLIDIYKNLKKKNGELEHVNNKLFKVVQEKKKNLKNKLKKHDLVFDFDDLEKKVQEKKKKKNL
ncbi:conserved protein, unknown function, partial [Hepatocystis sp. ex Piliocolobus tephrosceles]